jgi:hypothetical protein
MSVLKLRRDMVVVKEAPEAVVEIDKPFPLRTIEEEVTDIIEGEVAEVDPDLVEEHPRRSFMQVVRFWFNAAILVVMAGAYPTMIVMASDVGDRNITSAVDRAKWTAPWVGAASTLMEKHFNELGWASDSPSWAPMARLTAKPAYQAAMAASIGDFIGLEQAHSLANRQEDADLSAAARLVSAEATGVQLRAARDALINYDRRLRRRANAITTTPSELADQLRLIDTWASKSQTEIAAAAATAGNSPIDANATRAVYSAKGRAIAAFTFLDTMSWPQNPQAAHARAVAMDAWKVAAEFHPTVVLSGKADGSLFGNHAVSMGFLIARAQTATEEFLALAGGPPPAAPTPVATIANAIPAGALN